MKKMTAKTAIIILMVLAVLGFMIVFAIASKQENVSYKTVDAKLGNIIQTVSETGTVKASQELELSFLNSGKISRLNFKVGDMVKKDQLLAELDYASLVIAKQEAQANFDVATGNLNKLLAGATSEERALAEATVKQAETSFESAKNEMTRVRASMSEAISQAEKNLFDLQSDLDDNITTYEQAITTAETSLNNAKATNQKAIDDARTSSLITMEDKISSANTALDAVNRILTDDDAEDYLSVKNSVYKTQATAAYNEGISQKTSTDSSLTTAKISKSKNSVNSALTNTLYLLDLTLRALENTFSALDNSVTTSSFTQANIDSYKSTISTHLVTINTAYSLVTSSEQAYKTAILNYENSLKSLTDALAQAKSAYNTATINAQNAVNTAKANSEQQITQAQSRVDASMEALEVAEAQRDRTLATANSHDVNLSRARIRQAQAALDSINKQIENSQIKAPIDGQITELKFEIGEQATLGQGVISILGDGDYEIEVLISEADIAKVKVDDLADITLDAFGDENLFEGSVVFIEPAETVIQGVIYYQVTVKFDPRKEKIKSGMTANVIITTNQKQEVITVPQRAIVEEAGKKKLRLLVNNQIKMQDIVVGMRGDGGSIEVLDGIKIGDVIVTQINEK